MARGRTPLVEEAPELAAVLAPPPASPYSVSVKAADAPLRVLVEGAVPNDGGGRLELLPLGEQLLITARFWDPPFSATRPHCSVLVPLDAWSHRCDDPLCGYDTLLYTLEGSSLLRAAVRAAAAEVQQAHLGSGLLAFTYYADPLLAAFRTGPSGKRSSAENISATIYPPAARRVDLQSTEHALSLRDGRCGYCSSAACGVTELLRGYASEIQLSLDELSTRTAEPSAAPTVGVELAWTHLASPCVPVYTTVRTHAAHDDVEWFDLQIGSRTLHPSWSVTAKYPCVVCLAKDCRHQQYAASCRLQRDQAQRELRKSLWEQLAAGLARGKRSIRTLLGDVQHDL